MYILTFLLDLESVASKLVAVNNLSYSKVGSAIANCFICLSDFFVIIVKFSDSTMETADYSEHGVGLWFCILPVAIVSAVHA